MDWQSTAHRGPYRVQMATGEVKRVDDLGALVEVSARIDCVSVMDGFGTVWFEGDQRDPDCNLTGLEELERRHREHEADMAHFDAMREEYEGRLEQVFGKADF